MSDLSEFLRARLDEDEAAARAEVDMVARLIPADEFTVEYAWARFTEHVNGGSGSSFAPGAPSPARVLAEVAAKRAILDFVSHPGRPVGRDSDDTMTVVLRLLAKPYADHPDFDSTWGVA